VSLPDIKFESAGSIILARAHTPRGQQWLDEHVAFEHFFGGAGVLEHRYAKPIVEGAIRAELNVVIS
jgi:hypothetical protein